jgi:hypothetical protein
MKNAIILLLSVCIAACNQTTADAPTTTHISDEQAFASAKSQILASLKDPDSAKFGVFHRKHVLSPGLTLILLGYPAEKTDLVCGTVNSRNSFGGYTGAAVFAYRLGHRDVFLDEGPSGGRYGTMWCVESN